jgi:hypothetical protein
MLEYTLEENPLTDEAGDYRAQVVNVTSFTSGQLADRIMKIGAGLTRSDIASVLEAAKQVIADIIAEGGAVNFELFNAHPSIQGVFNGPEDGFDHGRHKIKVNLHPGSALRSAVDGIKVKKVAAVLTGTVITSVLDVKTGAVNTTLTPGRDIKITGAKLKIAGDDPAVGLYFVPPSGDPVKVDPTDFVINNPAEIIAVIPPLSAGVWRVRVVTQYTGGTVLKTPRTFTFDKDLTVGGPA